LRESALDGGGDSEIGFELSSYAFLKMPLRPSVVPRRFCNRQNPSSSGFSLNRGLRADGILNAGFFERNGIDRTAEVAGGGAASGRSAVFSNALQSGLDEFGIGRRLIVHTLPVYDEAVGLFCKTEPVAGLDFGAGLTADEDVNVRFAEAEDFFGAGDAALVRLANGLWKLAEDVLDAVENNLRFDFAPIGLRPVLFKQAGQFSA